MSSARIPGAWSAFAAWRRERLPLLPFVGVAVVIAAAADHLALVTVFQAFVWITALRLCDDVASRDHDALTHPARVLVRGPLAPFVRAAAGAVIVALVTAWWAHALFGFMAVLLALALAYRTPAPASVVKVLVLGKYPAMAWLLSSSSSTASLFVLFLCFVIDEFVTGERSLAVRALPFALTFAWLSLF